MRIRGEIPQITGNRSFVCVRRTQITVNPADVRDFQAYGLTWAGCFDDTEYSTPALGNSTQSPY
ncbi:hypothetical protein L21SP2_2124 [Salinispira pacifica]|uniref:Uncharacterized protein n=1 Tax=Salinispira pacifica TaxID=1307761 RepID=V5WJZ2_9SPIO|nr:hypothetical protein L21SP2_2124 [Salinispira pacifica]